MQEQELKINFSNLKSSYIPNSYKLANPVLYENLIKNIPSSSVLNPFDKQGIKIKHNVN